MKKNKIKNIYIITKTFLLCSLRFLAQTRSVPYPSLSSVLGLVRRTRLPVLALTWLPAFVNLHGQSLSSLLAKN